MATLPEGRYVYHEDLVDPNLHVNKDHNHDERYYTESEVNTLVASATIADATTSSKGKIQLAGELAGTAAAPTLKNVVKVFNVRDYGAVGNGSTDDTTAINSAITAAGVNGVIYFPPVSASYVYNSSMNPLNGAKLLGNRTKISTSAQASGHNGIINISNRSDVTIEGLVLEANIEATQSFTCLTSYGHTNLRIIDCTFTGTTNAFGGLLMLDGQNGSANMIETTIRGCRFVSAANSTRGIYLYARSSRTVERTAITNCYFEGIKGPAIYLDPYSDIKDTLVSSCRFKDMIYGGSSTAVGICLYLGVQATGKAYGTAFVGNTYTNTITTVGHQQGTVYFYNAVGVVIANNVLTGSWTTSQNIAGPCFAPGRIFTVARDITITGNRITGFDAAWDPDSMEHVQVANNVVSDCGESFGLGYGVQKYVSIHDNVSYNSPNKTYFTGILFANSTPVKCSIYNNTYVDDRATPVMTKAILLTGNFNYSDVAVFGNRFYVPSGTLTTGVSKLFNRELGSEVVPLIVSNNEVHDASGRTYEAPPAYASDVEVTDPTKGIVLRSPDGTRYRVTVANGGTLSTTVI